MPARRAGRTTMIRPNLTSILPLALLCACASAPKWTLRDPGPLSPEKRALLAEAEKSYRKGEPFDAMRAEIVADPVAAWWWARRAVLDVMSAREVRADGVEQGSAAGQHADKELERRIREGQVDASDDGSGLLRATAGKRDPVEERGLQELQNLGAAAVPCLVYDLACHKDGFSRQNGVDLLARQGDVALPLVRQELSSSPDAKRRRTAAQYFGARMPSGTAEDELLRMSGDADYGVRAAALAGLERGGAESRAALLRAVRMDADPLPRRSAAVALGAQPGRDAAAAICDFLARCQQERDTRGCEAAQSALQRHARSRGVRSLAAWRDYAASSAADGVAPTK
jgi:stage V sporulation protein SpoVS